MTDIQTEERQKRESKIHASVIRYEKTVFNAATALTALRDLEW